MSGATGSRSAALVLAASLCAELGCGAARSVSGLSGPTFVDASPPAPPAASTPSSEPPAPAPAPAPAAPTPVAAPIRASLRLERAIDVGKWPEGIAIVGDDAWVAESGARRVSRVGLAGQGAAVHVAVGRLPTHVAVAPSGKVYALAETDKAVWEIDPVTRRGRVFATVPDCPNAMALADGAAWVLLWQKCSSAESSIARVDLSTRKVSTSPATGRSGWSVGLSGGRAWVTLGDGTSSSVDATTLRDVRTHGSAHGPDIIVRHLATGPDAVFATTGAEVQRLDAAGAVTHAVTLGERIAALALAGDAVAAAGDAGHLWVLDAATLAIRRELTMPPPIDAPHAVAAWNRRWVITVFGEGEAHGQVRVLAEAPAPDEPAP